MITLSVGCSSSFIACRFRTPKQYCGKYTWNACLTRSQRQENSHLYILLCLLKSSDTSCNSTRLNFTFGCKVAQKYLSHHTPYDATFFWWSFEGVLVCKNTEVQHFHFSAFVSRWFFAWILHCPGSTTSYAFDRRQFPFEFSSIHWSSHTSCLMDIRIIASHYLHHSYSWMSSRWLWSLWTI